MEQTIEERAYKAVPDMLRINDNYVSSFVIGYYQGAIEEKEQMMKDVVEGKIVGGKCDLIHLKEGISDYRSSDKVKVIIIKE